MESTQQQNIISALKDIGCISWFRYQKLSNINLYDEDISTKCLLCNNDKNSQEIRKLYKITCRYTSKYKPLDPDIKKAVFASLKNHLPFEIIDMIISKCEKVSNQFNVLDLNKKDIYHLHKCFSCCRNVINDLHFIGCDKHDIPFIPSGDLSYPHVGGFYSH